MHSAALSVISDGQIAHCTFTINGSAAVGPSALTFVAAGMADAARRSYTASGHLRRRDRHRAERAASASAPPAALAAHGGRSPSR